jgi:hypothetical protein
VEKLHGVLAVTFTGVLLAIGSNAHAQSGNNSSVLHPAAPSQVITVTVKELRTFRHGKDHEFVIAQAAGFPTDACDVVTTFDVVQRYEERQTWSEVRQKIEIAVDGVSYPAKLREIGFYPLGLNLACVDFESPADRAAARISILPLDRNAQDSSTLTYDDGEIARSHPGTPFLNARGEISSVLIASPNGPLEFASAAELRQFLKVAATVSPWPVVHRRNSSI